MNKICKTCKWWKSLWHKYDFARPIEPQKGFGFCDSPKIDTGNVYPQYEKSVVCEDANIFIGCSDGFSLLQTQPDFGCVNWESVGETK